MSTQINYQQLFEDELDSVVKDRMNLSVHYSDVPLDARRFIEELIDLGYSRAVEDVLDPEILAETAELAGEMGGQLYNFANMLQSFLNPSKNSGAEN